MQLSSICSVAEPEPVESKLFWCTSAGALWVRHVFNNNKNIILEDSINYFGSGSTSSGTEIVFLINILL